MKTLQECFDISFLGLKEQGRPSRDVSGHCAYRGVYGDKCAVGHLVDDDELAIEMDDQDETAINSLYNRRNSMSIANRLEEEIGPFETHARLLSRLQVIHDGWFVCKQNDLYLVEKYQAVAKDYGLDDSVTRDN